MPIFLKVLPNTNSSNLFFVILIIIFILLTDFFDGYIARRLKQVTTLGKIIDPLADKIVIVSITYFITKYKSFPIWAFYIILIREILILSGAMLIFRKRNYIATSIFLGKISVFFISCSIFGYILSEFLPANLPYILLLFGLSFYLISFLSYFVRYLKIMSIIKN